MATPTVTELASWMKITTPPALSAEKTAVFQLCIDAALDDLTERCNLPAEWNAKITLACTMLAARYVKRSDSPEGVSGFADLGIVRVARLDSDVEHLVERYLKVEFA